jgi:mycofactocin system creatininase family protein
VTSLAALVWPQVAARGDGLRLVVPLGSCEQHGPHLPFDVDTEVAAAVAARLGDNDVVVVGPALAYGASGEHQGFPGTLSIGTDALTMVLLELGRSASSWASSVLFVSGHGGNAAALVAATTQLRAEGRDVAWWPCAVPGGDAHAGRTETSLALALLPQRVRPERAEAGAREPVGALMTRLRADGVAAVSPNGVLGDPAGATAAEGALLVDGLVERLRKALCAWQIGADGRLLP